MIQQVAVSINIVHVFPRGKAVLLASQHVVETTHIQRHLTQQMFIVLRGIRQPLNQPPGAVDVTTGVNMAHRTPSKCDNGASTNRRKKHIN